MNFLVRRLFFLLFANACVFSALALTPLEKAEDDTARINALNARARQYMESLSPMCLKLADSAYLAARRSGYHKGLRDALIVRSNMFYRTGNYARALKENLKLLSYSFKTKDETGLALAYNLSGLIFLVRNNPDLALSDLRKSEFYNRRLGSLSRLSANFYNKSMAYEKKNMLDSALSNIALSYDIAVKAKSNNMLTMAINKKGSYLLKLGRIDSAISCFNTVLENPAYQNDWEDTFAYAGLSEAALKHKNLTQAIKYAKSALDVATKINARWDISRAYDLLQQTYAKKGDFKNAYLALRASKAMSDSISSASKEKQFNTLQLKQKNIENQVLEEQNRLETEKLKYSRIIIVSVSLVVVLLLLYTITAIYALVKNKRLNRRLEKYAIEITGFNDAMRSKNKELEQINQSQQSLLSIISHDLRGPLASILSVAELWRSGDLEPEEEKMMLDAFCQRVRVTHEMMDNLLIWANLQVNGITTRKADIQLADLVTKVVSVYEVIATDKNITIHHHKGYHGIVSADPDQLRIILQNLISNALKFTHDHGQIVVSYNALQGQVLLDICDSGVGMDDAKLASLFKVIGKEISSYGTQSESGSGIGLSLVKRFADENQIEISVRSTPGKGSCFSLAIPYANVSI